EIDRYDLQRAILIQRFKDQGMELSAPRPVAVTETASDGEMSGFCTRSEVFAQDALLRRPGRPGPQWARIPHARPPYKVERMRAVLKALRSQGQKAARHG